MDEQQVGKYKILRLRDNDGDPFAIQFWTLVGKRDAVFYGPDREANAALFVRAQHMGELVEALRRFVRWADELDNDPAGTLAQARTILAKIEGAK